MKVAVLRFPGSNCDQDALFNLREDLGVQTEYVWQDESSLNGFDAAFVPGGFSYGDYLRCGAMAARSPIVGALQDFANDGHLVIGACNGFQILCEAGLLPGALLANEKQLFVCQDVYLKAETKTSPWTSGVSHLLKIPIAHGEGRYLCDEQTLKELEDQGRIAFRYVNEEGEATPEANPNGSTANIAGVLNAKGNVLGLMPHPERATREILGSADGLKILEALSLVKA